VSREGEGVLPLQWFHGVPYEVRHPRGFPKVYYVAAQAYQVIADQILRIHVPDRRDIAPGPGPFHSGLDRLGDFLGVSRH
jgi:hypothetical protein